MDLHWHVRYAPNTGTYYAKATRRIDGIDGESKKSSVYLHIEIANPEHDKDIYVDHEDHDTLNNRKYNLRSTINKKNLSHRNGANSNNKTGVRNVNLVNLYGGKQEYWVQFCRDGERFKWEFPIDQFQEACDFADIKRVEIFGEFAGNG